MKTKVKILSLAAMVCFCLWIFAGLAHSIWKSDLLFMTSLVFFACTLLLFTTEALVEKKIAIRGLGTILRSQNPKSYWFSVLAFAAFSLFLCGMLLKFLFDGLLFR